MKIAILGHGTVGQGVSEIINDAPAGKSTAQIEIAYVWVRPEKTHERPYYTANYQEILEDPTVDVIVEVLGGLEPARTMILAALEHGKHVVTANKAVVARYLVLFNQMAEKHGVKFYFESSVGGGIPWIINLERALRIDEVDSIHGIFNGTSNFILDQMTKTGASFEDVLKEAQDLGYAEADPSADIDGFDIENKLCISADIAYNTVIEPGDQLLKFGIRNITAADIAFFKEHNWVVKLLGRSLRKEDTYSFIIEPTLYLPGEIEAGVHDNYNYVGLRGTTIGKLSFNGQGAGKLPTAHALMQDLLDLQQGANHLYQDFDQKLVLDNRRSIRNYVIRTTLDLRQFFADYDLQQNGPYWLVADINAEDLHRKIAELIQQDEHIFFACLNRRAQAIL
ncbi:homoserine dehydrogenase [Convivina intestini]|uniref:homoserine dehydrogenase n=1 Tax=Convivina intestini TaxID=1505726 RepID=UPI0020101B3F|nr:homoserine dehydrogenase [Convivina intestini]CAH1853229.1 hypothetical protein R078131_00667 [Convivina intestini]